MASRTRATIELIDLTPEQLLEIEGRHQRVWPRLGWYEHADSNADVLRLIKALRQLTGWKRPNDKLFEKRLGRILEQASKARRKAP